MDLGFTLAQDETVIRKVHRHWIVLTPALLAAIAIVLITIMLTYMFSRYRSTIPSSITTMGLVVLVVILLALAGVIVIAGLWVYKRNFLVLTNQHLVRVEQKGLFNHSVSQLALDRVQDVSGSTSGFLATILGFGNITVETAGAEDNFIFTAVSDPASMTAACLKAHEEFAPDIPAKPTPISAPETTAETMPIPPTPPTPAPAPPGMVEEIVYVPAPEAVPEPTPEPEAPSTHTAPIPMTESVVESIEHKQQ
jgi:membrane protein YdbS with pleckstrin-like domain